MRLIFYRRVGDTYVVIHGRTTDSNVPATPAPTSGLGISPLGTSPLGGS